MNQLKKISVIVPVYNTALYLERCLLSIIDNTYKNLEIICVNDGSTDDSLSILKAYADKDKRIIIVNQKNKGLSAARNAGITIASGEYISFIDSDDWIHPDYFKILMEPMMDMDVGISVCGYVRTADNFALKRIIPSEKFEILSRVRFMEMRGVKVYVTMRIYRKKDLASLSFDECVKIEDADFNARLISQSKDIKIAYTSAVLYAYFIREGSLVSAISAPDYVILSQQLYECALYEKDAEMQQAFSLDCLKRLLFARYVYMLIGDKKSAKKCYSMAEKTLKLIHKGRGKYRLMLCFPQIYRWFRILNDPTMLKWEKSQKRKNR